MHDRNSASGTGTGGDMIGVETIDNPAIGEKEDAIVIAAGDKVIDAVVFFHFRASFAPCCPILGLKGINGHSFDVTLFGDEN